MSLVVSNAIREWVMRSTGLDATKVILAEQDGSRPAVPFAELRLGDMLALGTTDALTQSFDPDAVLGEECTQTVRGQREFSTTLRVFTESAVGDESARARLGRAQAFLGLPSIRAVFAAAGIACFDSGQIQVLPSVLDTKWEGRATLTCRFYAAQEVTESTTYVATVDFDGEVSG